MYCSFYIFMYYNELFTPTLYFNNFDLVKLLKMEHLGGNLNNKMLSLAIHAGLKIASIAEKNA